MGKLKLLVVIAIMAVVGYFFFQEEIEVLRLPSSVDEVDVAIETVEVRKRVENGKLKADAQIIGGKRNGVSNNYYSDGSLHSSLNYVDDVKHGEAVWYYRNGKPYRVTSFVRGEKSGIQKKYYENGVLMAEIPYDNGKLQPGTKEYWETGKLKTKYPEVIIDRNNPKVLIVSTQPYVKKAKHYAICESAGKTVKVVGEEQKKTGVIDLTGFDGKATVYVEYKTKMGNKKLEARLIEL